jgi:hypothetical protein
MFAFLIFILIVVNLLLSFIVGHYGEKREITSLGAFLVSLFFSPIIGFVCVSLSNKIDENYVPNKDYIFVLKTILFVSILSGFMSIFLFFYIMKNKKNNLEEQKCSEPISNYQHDYENYGSKKSNALWSDTTIIVEKAKAPSN